MSIDVVPDWLDNLLVCVECRGTDLKREEGGFRCFDCGTQYEIVNRVPLFHRPSTMVDAAESLASYLGGLDLLSVQRALSTALRYRLKDPELRGEFSQIVERYPFIDTTEQSARSEPSPDFEVIAHYFNPVFNSAKEAYRSFRIKSNVDYTLKSVGERPFNLSYWLTDASGQRIEGVRSALPIPLHPGRELTVPILIAAPDTAGEYRIQIMLVQEFERWRDDCILYDGPISVVATVPPRPGLVTPPHAGYFDFNEDIARSGKVISLAAEMLRRETGSNELMILEIACGNDPQVLRHNQPGSLVVACDLSFPQAQLGSLRCVKEELTPVQNFCFISADVFNAPFREASFDIIVICAALHHFANITVALDQLRKLLKPRGKLVVLREPGKVAANDPTYIRELENGFNEQQFELDEYDVMFERSKFRPIYQQLDFECSYKAILAT